MRKISGCFFFLLLLTACSGGDQKPSIEPVENSPTPISYTLVNTLPHDTSSFTEGLLFHDGQLYESTGMDIATMPPSRHSLFGLVNPKTGKIETRAEIDRNKYFGEGICFLGDKVYQLTWTTKVGFIYNSKTFARVGQFTIPVAQGWGMTTNGKDLILSDGTSNITYMDPSGFNVVKTLAVSDNNGPVNNLNELEMIHGFLYANRWETDDILKIDTATGKVVGIIDLKTLVDATRNQYPDAAEMNGIAYDQATDRIYITGKLWPHIYEIRFDH